MRGRLCFQARTAPRASFRRCVRRPREARLSTRQLQTLAASLTVQYYVL